MANEYKDVIRVWVAKAADVLKNKILVKQFGATTDTYEIGAKDPSGDMMYCPSDLTPLPVFKDLSIVAWQTLSSAILFGDGVQAETFLYDNGQHRLAIGTTTPFNDVATTSGDFVGRGVHIKGTSTPSRIILESIGAGANGSEAGSRAGYIIFAGDNGAGADEKIMFINGGGRSIRFGGMTDAGVEQGDVVEINTSRVEFRKPIRFSGTGHIDRYHWNPDAITLNAGTTSSSLSDLQQKFDGNFYHINEAAATPGMNLEIEWQNITYFQKVQLLAIYNGADTHAVAVQMYNFNQSRWDTIGSLQNHQEDVSTSDGYIVDSVVRDLQNAGSEYIGTGADAGKVKMRLYHTMAGNASHDMWIDSAELLQ